MSNVSLNTMRSLSPLYGENTTVNTNCSLPPTYGDESYGYKTGGISKINLNAGCSLPPTQEYKQWPSIWEKENQGSNNAAFIGNANLNTIA